MKSKLMATLLLSIAFNVYAQQQPPLKQPLQVTVSTKKIFKSGTKEEKIEAVRADVGDVIEYTLQYKNISEQTARDVKVAFPIPDGYTYQKNSASPILSEAPTESYLVWSLGTIKVNASVSVSAKFKLVRIPKK